MGGKKNCFWHNFKNIISGRKIQFNFQNDQLNQSMTGLYNQYLLPLNLAAFLERSFSKIVLFSATFHCVLCKLFWLCLLQSSFFFGFDYNKELNQPIALHMKEQIFLIPVCISLLFTVSYEIGQNILPFSEFLYIILAQQQPFLSLLSSPLTYSRSRLSP